MLPMAKMEAFSILEIADLVLDTKYLLNSTKTMMAFGFTVVFDCTKTDHNSSSKVDMIEDSYSAMDYSTNFINLKIDCPS